VIHISTFIHECMYAYTPIDILHACVPFSIHTYIHDTHIHILNTHIYTTHIFIHNPYLHNTSIHIHTCIYESTLLDRYPLLSLFTPLYTHVYITHIYTWPIHMRHTFTFIHVYACMNKHMWTNVSLCFSLILSPSLTLFLCVPPPLPSGLASGFHPCAT